MANPKPDPSRVLVPWQFDAVRAIAATPHAADLRFGGATALAALHLQHRRSMDLDFFCAEPPRGDEVTAVARALAGLGLDVDTRAIGPRFQYILSRRGGVVGHVDVSLRPFEPVDRPSRWMGLWVDSFTDLAVDKTQALLTRGRDRDFVDFHFLFAEGPVRDVDRLLGLVRAKFDAGGSRYTLAERLAAVEQVEELPEMLRPLTIEELRASLLAIARDIVRSPP